MSGLEFSAILPSLIGGLAVQTVSSLMKDDAPTPPPAAAAPAEPIPEPVVEPVTPMPGVNDAARKTAQRRSIAQQAARRGRASTILTDDADAKLGG